MKPPERTKEGWRQVRHSPPGKVRAQARLGVSGQGKAGLKRML